MISAFLPLPVLPEHIGYRQMPAVIARGPVAEGRPLLGFGDAGTGGVQSAQFHIARAGYRSFEIVLPVQPQNPAHVGLMNQVKDGFGRTMSRLPEIFGVSRQTLYNWLSGETPKEQHHGKLNELAAAAGVFKELGFKPTSVSLDRTVSQGKSFLQLLSAGANGAESARMLMRIVQRGAESKDKLDTILGQAKHSRLDVADMGTPSFPEDV